MGHKWLEAFSKAMTYLGSGVTALTGTMQAALPGGGRGRGGPRFRRIS